MAPVVWKQGPTTESEATPRNVDSAWFAGLRSVLIEQDGVNYIANPSVETNTTGHSTAGTNTIAQSPDEARFGEYSLKCTYGNSLLFDSYPVEMAAADYMASLWLLIPAAYDGAQLRVSMNGLVGVTGSVSTDADMAIRDEWQRVVVGPFVPDAGDVIGALAVEESVAPTVGRVIYLDGLQVEEGRWATSYLDGAQGTGYVWTATAHASPSMRTTGLLSFADLAPRLADEGSVVLWVEPQQASSSGSGPATSYYLTLGGDADGIALRFTRANGRLAISAIHTAENGAEQTANVHVNASWSAGEAVCMYVGWGPDGALSVGFNGTMSTISFFAMSIVTPYLAGGTAHASNPPNAAYSAVAFFDKQLAESLFAAMAAVTSPPSPGDFVGAEMLALFIADDQP